MTKRYLIIIAVAWILLASGWLAWLSGASADEPVTMYVHVSDGSYLNGRREATKDSPVEMRLQRGDAVEVVTLDGGWAEIIGGEAGTAWCSVTYLASYPPDEDAPQYTVVSNGRVRVRETPGGTTAGYVRNGDTVTVQFVIDGWAYIGSGYIMIEYLEAQENE